MKSRHSLGPINLARCENENDNENIYEKYAKQAKEGTIRKSVEQLVENLKKEKRANVNLRLPV